MLDPQRSGGTNLRLILKVIKYLVAKIKALKHQSLWRLNSTPCWSVFLYSATFEGWDFIQLFLILITTSERFLIYFLKQWYFFFKLNQSWWFFLQMYPFHVCLSPTFVPVQCLYQSNICTSPTFVPVQPLYQS